MGKIMIVEDDAIHAELSTLLSANGCQPVTELPCGLILMDENLQGQ